MHAIPWAALSCNSLRYDRVLHLSVLLKLCHVKCYDHTVSHHLLWVVQKFTQSIFDTLLIAQASKCLGCLMPDHACLLCVTERFCKTRDGCGV